jgi:hypothetical protein
LLNGGIPIVAIAGDTNRLHSWKNMTQSWLKNSAAACRAAALRNRGAVPDNFNAIHNAAIGDQAGFWVSAGSAFR